MNSPDAVAVVGGDINGAIPRASFSGLGPLVLPRNQEERRLVAIWQRILKVVPISIKDHWFDLGGDSLGATVLFAEIEAAFGKKMPLGMLLEADTVAKLASLLDPRPTWRNRASLISHPTGTLPPLYCVHGLHGTADFAAFLAQYLGPEQPVVGFQARGLAIGIAEPSDSVTSMAADYAGLLRLWRRAGPYRLTGWCVGSLIAFEMARLLVAEGEEIARLILIDPPAWPLRQSAASESRQAIDRLQDMEVVSDLARDYRDAVMRTVFAIDRAIREYRFGSYPGDLFILCSEENFASMAAKTSPWRAAVRGRLMLKAIAPTHMSLVEDHMPQLASHVRRLLGTSWPA